MALVHCDRRCAKADHRVREIFPFGYSLAFHRVHGRPQTRRVGNANRDAAQIDVFLDRVARGSGSIADDGTVVAEQPIEQTRFARVSRAVNHHAHAFAQNAALIRGREQVFDSRLRTESNRARSLSPSSGAIPSSGKSIAAFDVRDQCDQFVANRANSFAEPPLELFGGGAQGKISLRANQIDHRLRLRQIHFPIDEMRVR